eukprot:1174989-Prymnesium_polylepis.2
MRPSVYSILLLAPRAQHEGTAHAPTYDTLTPSRYASPSSPLYTRSTQSSCRLYCTTPLTRAPPVLAGTPDRVRTVRRSLSVGGAQQGPRDRAASAHRAACRQGAMRHARRRHRAV